jgi:antitoxin component of MazEF toxin-antitoxin module
MKAKLVRIGNSWGVRLPTSLIEEAGLGDEVELRVRGSAPRQSQPHAGRGDPEAPGPVLSSRLTS